MFDLFDTLVQCLVHGRYLLCRIHFFIQQKFVIGQVDTVLDCAGMVLKEVH